MPDSVHPPLLYPPYLSTLKRAPRERLVAIPSALADRTGPVFDEQSVGPLDDDLTQNARSDAEPIGERIVVSGRVLDRDGRAVSNALLEVWQANSAGRYAHWKDDHAAPLDPNFLGTGRCLTNDQGEYSFTTIRPGAYPWLNHHNAWRPPHIHFSVFGRSFAERLVTQMYFPGDPLLALDPIYNSVPSERGRHSLISRYDHALTQPAWALGFRFDIVLGGRSQTAFEEMESE